MWPSSQIYYVPFNWMNIRSIAIAKKFVDGLMWWPLRTFLPINLLYCSVCRHTEKKQGTKLIWIETEIRDQELVLRSRDIAGNWWISYNFWQISEITFAVSTCRYFLCCQAWTRCRSSGRSWAPWSSPGTCSPSSTWPIRFPSPQGSPPPLLVLGTKIFLARELRRFNIDISLVKLHTQN